MLPCFLSVANPWFLWVSGVPWLICSCDISVDAFRDLSQQIIHLSVEHFQFLPIEPPHEVLMKIPPGIPNFLDNTQPSREIRAAYVQHLVSNILTYRIFQ